MIRNYVRSHKSIILSLVAVSIVGLCTAWFAPTSLAATTVAPSQLGGSCVSKCAGKQNACVIRCGADESCIMECAAKGQECIADC